MEPIIWFLFRLRWYMFVSGFFAGLIGSAVNAQGLFGWTLLTMLFGLGLPGFFLVLLELGE